MVGVEVLEDEEGKIGRTRGSWISRGRAPLHRPAATSVRPLALLVHLSPTPLNHKPPKMSSNPLKPTVLVAVQDTPQAFDLPTSIAKLATLTASAAARARDDAVAKWGAETASRANILVVFPEAFLSAYPRGLDFGAVVGSRTDAGRAWFRRYHESSVPVGDVEGPEMSAIRKAARDNGVTLVVGVIERCDCPASGPPRSTWGAAEKGGSGTLYCCALTISPTGVLLSAHRKLAPTGSERLVWGQGSRGDIRAADTPVGRVGAAICWENYVPLFRHALYEEGVEVWAAPTADAREVWQGTMGHVALEGRCFVVSCNQFNRRRDYPEDYPSLTGKYGRGYRTSYTFHSHHHPPPPPSSHRRQPRNGDHPWRLSHRLAARQGPRRPIVGRGWHPYCVRRRCQGTDHRGKDGL